LFTDDIIIHAENLKESITTKQINTSPPTTKALLEPIHNYCKVAGYKANIQKSIALPYVNNEPV
jgi:hypothetical protein